MNNLKQNFISLVPQSIPTSLLTSSNFKQDINEVFQSIDLGNPAVVLNQSQSQLNPDTFPQNVTLPPQMQAGADFHRIHRNAANQLYQQKATQNQQAI